MNPTRILVPVDSSACATAAVDCALAVADLYDAPVTLLHAWEPVYELGVVLGAATIATQAGEISLTQHIAEEAEKTLNAHRDRLSESQIVVDTRLVEGAPKAAIRDALDTGEFDLVVMGTHGRTGLSHVVMGSVAEWVVRHAPVPVMTIRSAPEGAVANVAR